MKVLNTYFIYPIIFDISISAFFAMVFDKLIQKDILILPKRDFILSSVSDIANISFSSTGFILTILTVLITFKAGSRNKNKIKNYDSALDYFFHTPLYAQTTYHLKNCIKSLVMLAVTGYLLKITISDPFTIYLFHFLIFSISVLALTLTRCLLILNKVLELQNK